MFMLNGLNFSKYKNGCKYVSKVGFFMYIRNLSSIDFITLNLKDIFGERIQKCTNNLTSEGFKCLE